MDLGKLLKAARIHFDKKSNEVAEAIRLKPATYSNYENNVSQPGIEVLLALSKFYGVTIDGILNGNFENEERTTRLSIEIKLYGRDNELEPLKSSLTELIRGSNDQQQVNKPSKLNLDQIRQESQKRHVQVGSKKKDISS